MVNLSEGIYRDSLREDINYKAFTLSTAVGRQLLQYYRSRSDPFQSLSRCYQRIGFALYPRISSLPPILWSLSTNCKIKLDKWGRSSLHIRMINYLLFSHLSHSCYWHLTKEPKMLWSTLSFLAFVAPCLCQYPAMLRFGCSQLVTERLDP